MNAPQRNDSWLDELAAIGDTERRYQAAKEIRAEIVEAHKVGDKVAVPCCDCDGQGCDECHYSGGVIGEVLECDGCRGEGQIGVVMGDQFIRMAECARCHGQGRVLVTEP